MAVALAGAIGVERERKGRAAGLRTHVLVCLGATLAMIVGDLLARQWAGSDASVWLDKGRIAAGVITGVGFLGAGTIINVGGEQRGLTTAAMIWFVAALGLSIGAGFYWVAVCATILTLLAVILLEYVEGIVPSGERFTLVLHLPRGQERIGEVEEIIRGQGFHVVVSRLRISSREEILDMTFTVSSRSEARIGALAEFLSTEISHMDLPAASASSFPVSLVLFPDSVNADSAVMVPS